MRRLTQLVMLRIVIATCVLLPEYAHCAPLRLAIIHDSITSPHVASGPGDAVYVVWHDKEETDDEEAPINIFFKRSLNGGASFDETIVIENDDTPDRAVTYPQMAVAADGTVYIVYSKYEYDLEDGQFRIIVNKSVDNGATFEKETVYSEPLGGFLTGENFAFFGANIRILENRIYYTWSGEREIFLARSDDENQFEIFDIEDEGNQDDNIPTETSKIHPALAVDPNQNVYVAWLEAHLEDATQISLKYDLYTTKLESDQQQFSEIKKLGKVGTTGQMMGRPFIEAHSSDSVFVAYNTPEGCMSLSSNDGGDSFSAPLNTKLGISTTVFNYKTILDPRDAMHFLYISVNNSTLYYSQSPDYGESVQDTVKIALPIASQADMDWCQEKELAYIVWFNPQDNSIYFSNSLDEAGDEQPPAPDPAPSTTDGGGGGGGGCFIQSMLEAK
jgi:hypothetical protein